MKIITSRGTKNESPGHGSRVQLPIFVHAKYVTVKGHAHQDENIPKSSTLT